MDMWQVITWHPTTGLARTKLLRDVYSTIGGLRSGTNSKKGINTQIIQEDENTYIARYMAESAPNVHDKPTNTLLIARRIHLRINGHKIHDNYHAECPNLSQFVQDEDNTNALTDI